MKLFNVYFREPRVVQIPAETQEDARERFLQGEFDDASVINDRDGEIGEPTSIVLWDEVAA